MINSLKRAIIIGGGIGGLSAAIALEQVGVEVVVYEKTTTLEAMGVGLTLWPNALKVLRKFSLAKEVIRAGARIQRGEIRTARGKILSRLQPRELEKRFDAPTVAIHRADLQRILLSVLSDNTIRTGWEFSSFRQNTGGMEAKFVNGNSDEADLLVGADGIHSALRRQLFPGVTLRYGGYTAWRGVAEVNGHSIPDVTSESWGRGARFGVVPIGRGRIYWFATANRPEGAILNPGERKEFLRRRFKGWHYPVEFLIESTPDEAILHNDIYDFNPFQPWSHGREVLLGDAAHAATPNMGQGACMAIESAAVLASSLADSQDLEEGLRRYQAARMPRAAWITEQSRKIGRVGQLENPLACALRNTALRLTPPAIAKRTLETATGYEL